LFGILFDFGVPRRLDRWVAKRRDPVCRALGTSRPAEELRRLQIRDVGDAGGKFERRAIE
jgi:hypothetical protein